MKVVISSYIEVREATESNWEQANLEFDLKSNLQESKIDQKAQEAVQSNRSSILNSSPSSTIAFSSHGTTNTPTMSASTQESSSTTTSTTPSTTTLAIPDDLPGEKTTTSSTTSKEKSKRASEITSTERTTTIPSYHTNLIEELQALKEEYKLHGVCLQCLQILYEWPKNIFSRPGSGAVEGGNEKRSWHTEGPAEDHK